MVGASEQGSQFIFLSYLRGTWKAKSTQPACLVPCDLSGIEHSNTATHAFTIWLLRLGKPATLEPSV